MNNWHSYCRDSITIYLHVPWRECFWACRQFPVSNRLALSRSLNRWSSGGTLTTESRPEPWGRRWMSGGFQLRNASKIPSGGATGRQGRKTELLKKVKFIPIVSPRWRREQHNNCLGNFPQRFWMAFYVTRAVGTCVGQVDGMWRLYLLVATP